jgi:hypothetical protein
VVPRGSRLHVLAGVRCAEAYVVLGDGERAGHIARRTLGSAARHLGVEHPLVRRLEHLGGGAPQ